MRFRVARAWTATYPDPISLATGDPVSLTGRRDLWEGHVWLWAMTPSGRQGWIPDSLVAGDPPRACRDYTARELTCAEGDLLDGGEETHGWVWCRAAQGGEGWVPRRNLAPV